MPLGEDDDGEVDAPAGVVETNASGGTDGGAALDVGAGVLAGVIGVGGADAAVTGPATGGTYAAPDLFVTGAGVGVGGGADTVV